MKEKKEEKHSPLQKIIIAVIGVVLSVLVTGGLISTEVADSVGQTAQVLVEEYISEPTSTYVPSATDAPIWATPGTSEP